MPYKQGAVNVTQGSTVLTGVDTDWLGQRPEWWVWIAGEDRPHFIASVVSATEITLSDPVDRASGIGLDYAITPTQGLVSKLVHKLEVTDGLFQETRNSWEAVLADFSCTAFQTYLDQPGNAGKTYAEFQAEITGAQGPQGNPVHAARLAILFGKVPVEPAYVLDLTRDLFFDGLTLNDFATSVTLARASDALTRTASGMAVTAADTPELPLNIVNGKSLGLRGHDAVVNLCADPFDLTNGWSMGAGVTLAFNAAGGPIAGTGFTTVSG